MWPTLPKIIQHLKLLQHEIKGHIPTYSLRQPLMDLLFTNSSNHFLNLPPTISCGRQHHNLTAHCCKEVLLAILIYSLPLFRKCLLLYHCKLCWRTVSTPLVCKLHDSVHLNHVPPSEGYQPFVTKKYLNEHSSYTLRSSSGQMPSLKALLLQLNYKYSKILHKN